eukprot:1797238-Lingulodinium_polyedra.AAC.1
MRTAGDPRETPAPEWEEAREEEDPSEDADNGTGRGTEDGAGQLPCAVWEPSSRVACRTCSELRACRIRRALSDASTAHAADHGVWRPHAARASPG